MNKTMATMMMLTMTGALGVACATTERGEHTAVPVGSTSVATQVAQNNACNDWEIYFVTGSAEVSPATRAVLERLATCIRSGDVRDVVVSGNADPRGGAEENQELGQRRADAIRGVLVAHGCRPEVVRAHSHGESAATGSPETYASERRVSVRTRERAN